MDQIGISKHELWQKKKKGVKESSRATKMCLAMVQLAKYKQCKDNYNVMSFTKRGQTMKSRSSIMLLWHNASKVDNVVVQPYLKEALWNYKIEGYCGSSNLNFIQALSLILTW